MTVSAADPDSLVQTAISLYGRGQFQAAESCCRKALKMRPAHQNALEMLGISLNAQGAHGKASQIFAELTQRDPQNARHWVNLGTALQAQRRHDEALAAYSRAAALGEASASFWYNVGLVHFDLGNFEEARNTLGNAARLAPDDAQICYQYAVCCDETMRQNEAVAALEHWSSMQGLTTDLLAKIALLLMKLGELPSAALAVERALLDPTPDPEALLRIMQVQERTNQVQQAREALAQLKRHPSTDSLGTDLKLVDARLAERDGRLQDALELYREILEATPELHLQHHYLFPLAKTLDALHRHDEAFTALEKAHQSQLSYLKRAMPRAAAWQSPPFRITNFDCDPADVAVWDDAGSPDFAASPIFIVGFPRSGTTLLEQTLDAHPLLVSMDETRFLYEVIDEMSGGSALYPEKLAAISGSRLDELRSSYWGRVRRKVELAPGQRLVDKNPLNLMALPAIRRLFPQARILLTVRHPCDVILSCFMQHFLAPDIVLMCRDLESLVTGYRRAFDFWYRQVDILQPRVHELRYESFVSEFEDHAREIAAFLELPWTDAMLKPGDHARRKGFISTPSYSQVVQPVNTRAVGRWKAYQSHFSEVLPALRPYLARWGYEG